MPTSQEIIASYVPTAVTISVAGHAIKMLGGLGMPKRRKKRKSGRRRKKRR